MIKKLLITVPTHTGYIFSECVTSLISNINILTRSGINVKYVPILKEAYLARAKNRAIKMLIDDTTIDALIIVDYDLGFDPQAMARLVVADVDVVGGSYPYKTGVGYPAVPAKTSDGKYIISNKNLLAATFVPGGFIMMKRNAIAAMDKALKIKDSEGLRFYFDEGFVFDDDQRWYGEDKTLCKRLLKAGVGIWIEPNITFAHVGVSGQSGNYAQYLNSETVKSLSEAAA
jgi:hypothetical protein